MENKIINSDLEKLKKEIKNITSILISYNFDDGTFKQGKFETSLGILWLFQNLKSIKNKNIDLIDVNNLYSEEEIECNLCYRYKSEKYKDPNTIIEESKNNYQVLIKYILYNNNCYNNKLNLSKFLFDLFKEKINDYYIVITHRGNINNLEFESITEKNFSNHKFIENTYFYYCLYKLAMLAYSNKFKLKIYFATMEKLFKCDKENNIDDINKFNSIELGTKEQNDYYNNKIIYEIHKDNIKDNINYLLYYIIISILNLNYNEVKKNRNELEANLYPIVNLI